MVPDKLITADCHIAPPYELIDELPEHYREYFPRIEKDENGKDTFKAGHIVSMAMMAGEGAESDITADATGAVGNVVAEAHPSFDAAEQLADLERDGVYGAVLIGRITDMPNAIPADADSAYCKVVNDWLAETWGPYLDRVAPGIHLPFKDVAASVAELERTAGMGLRPALLPDGIFERPYYMDEWEPLWEAADSLRIPITMHVGGLRSPLVGPGLMAYPGRQDIGWYMQSCGMGETLGWMTYSGVVRALSQPACRHDRGVCGVARVRDAVLRPSLQPEPAARPRDRPHHGAGQDRRAPELLPEAAGTRHVHVGSAGDSLTRPHRTRLPDVG